MDKRTDIDGQKKRYTEAGAPHKNLVPSKYELKNVTIND